MAEPFNAANSVFLAGQIHALLTFAQVLAMNHPNPRQLLSEFEAAEQVGLANTENQLANERLVEGYQFAVGQIRKALAIATETALNQNKD